MTRVTSPRLQISYPNATLRDELPDVPGDMKRIVDGAEKAMIYEQNTIANRPAFGRQGVIFKATDEGIFYYDNGAAWEKLVTESWLSWRHIFRGSVLIVGTFPPVDYIAVPSSNNIQSSPSSFGDQGIFYLDPADYAIAGKTTKYKIRLGAITGNTGPGIVTELYLRRITTPTGVGTDKDLDFTLSTAYGLAGIAVPGPNQMIVNESTEFTPPTVGWFVMDVKAVSGTFASNAIVRYTADLLVKNVN